jgi:membrane protease YdiL (CAAX protease family)
VLGPQRLLDAREIAAIALTFSANAVVHRVLPDETHIPANLLAAAGALGFAAWAGASVDDLGVRSADLGTGARVGLVVSGAIVAGVGLAAALPRTRVFFADSRVSEVGHRRAFYELALRIPIGTALSEELLFRSGLTALFAQRRPWPVAVATSSALFGLWHVLPTVESLDTNPAVGPVHATRVRTAGAVAGVVATTAAAGVGFSLLGRRARSVLAPVLVHATLNAATYAAGRVIALMR